MTVQQNVRLCKRLCYTKQKLNTLSIYFQSIGMSKTYNTSFIFYLHTTLMRLKNHNLPYSDYLQTRHWKLIKKKMYEKYRECQSCGAKRDLDVHHVNGYKNLWHETLSELMLLCRSCHYRAHRKKLGVRFLRPSDFFFWIHRWFIHQYTLPEPKKRVRRYAEFTVKLRK